MTRWLLLALVLALISPAQAAQERSGAVLRLFRAAHECPSTGLKTGPCPGFQMDHALALVCGGLDIPANIRWLSVEQHKVKTRKDLKCRYQKGVRGGR